MINRNIFGLIGFLFGILVIFSIFNSLSNSLDKKQAINNFNILKENLDYICEKQVFSSSFNFKLYNTNNYFKIKRGLEENSLCLDYDFENYFYCEKFNCDFNFNGDLVDSSINPYDKNDREFFLCNVTKLDKNILGVNCFDEFGNSVSSFIP